MQAEFLQLQSSADHNAPPDVRWTLPDQVFDAAKDTKEVQVHPSDLKKMTYVAANLDVA
jgi:hypothetical protein